MVATRGTRLAALALAPRLAGMAELVQITDKVHLARGHAVNWVLVTDDTGVLCSRANQIAEPRWSMCAWVSTMARTSPGV